MKALSTPICVFTLYKDRTTSTPTRWFLPYLLHSINQAVFRPEISFDMAKMSYPPSSFCDLWCHKSEGLAHRLRKGHRLWHKWDNEGIDSCSPHWWSGAYSWTWKVASRLVEECRQAFSIVLPYTKNEREFLNRILEYGEIEPSSITSDEKMANLIGNHPDLNWKTLNVRKFKGIE